MLEVVPPIVPITAVAFPIGQCQKALPQVEERLGFSGDLFETATQTSQERESLGRKRACCLNGQRCEDMALVEGCVLLLALLSLGCHCPCLSGGTW